jgi:hypothetical protein
MCLSGSTNVNPVPNEAASRGRLVTSVRLPEARRPLVQGPLQDFYLNVAKVVSESTEALVTGGDPV